MTLNIAEQEKFIRTVKKFYIERELYIWDNTPPNVLLTILSKTLRDKLNKKQFLEYLYLSNKKTEDLNPNEKEKISFIIDNCLKSEETLSFFLKSDLNSLNQINLEGLISTPTTIPNIIQVDSFGNAINDGLKKYAQFLQSTKCLSSKGKTKIKLFTNSTYSAAIGILINNASNKKSYLKISSNPVDILRERFILTHLNGCRLLPNYIPKIIYSNSNGFISADGFNYLLTTDISKKPSIDLYKKKYFKRINANLEDLISNRIYICAAFHCETKEIIKNGYNKVLFDREPFKKFEIIRPYLEKQNIQIRNLEAIYNEIFEKYSKLKKNIYAHNDLKEDNWILSNLIDFGSVSLGHSSEIETLLLNISSGKKNYYRQLYLSFREMIEIDDGYDYKKVGIKKFERECIMRGFLDSARFLNWNLKINNLEKSRFYLNTLGFYIEEVQRNNICRT